MKINRVMLSSNNDINYYPFWNHLSKIYSQKFKIRPTLVWVGDEEDFKKCDLSDLYGDILIVNPNINFPISSQCTWANFWATQFYPEDICFICGIDEVPLSKMFLGDIISQYQDDSYIMLIADAYLPNHWSLDRGTSPSGQHVAKGSTFAEIYEFENNFVDEVEKVFNSGCLQRHLEIDPRGYNFGQNFWGIDETYFSEKLRRSERKYIVSLPMFGLMKERRIDCHRHYEVAYDLERLKNGWYSQAHLCRPFAHHEKYLRELFDNINYFD